MEVGLILKIAGIGFIVSVLCQVLTKNGRGDHSDYVSLAGIIIIIFILINKVGELIEVIKGVFGVVWYSKDMRYCNTNCYNMCYFEASRLKYIKISLRNSCCYNIYNCYFVPWTTYKYAENGIWQQNYGNWYAFFDA